MKKFTLPLLSVLLLGGCANELYSDLHYYMKEKKLPPPTEASFPHCEGYGCPAYKNVELSKADWKRIEKAFGSKSKDAAQERGKIAQTIGEFERIVGPITGTDVDERGTFVATGKGQLDCVDESTNTTIFLMLLKQKGMLSFHEINQPQVRWPIISGRGWMHQTAVIADKKTGEQFAVDSWFEDNGVNAWIVPLDSWRNGWHPDQMKKS
jgi:hypothetical protein